MNLIIVRNWIVLASGTISFSSSLLMVAMIPRPHHGGLSTPYRRIIFSLSISDVIQSLATVLGLFFIPKDKTDSSSGSSWAIGNIVTCDLQGFMSTFGATTTCMNSLLLCLYYNFKLKKNMSDGIFTKIIEARVHCFIVFFNLMMCSVILATKTFNPVSVVGTCQIMRKPYGCDPSVPGSCERGHYAKLFTLIYFPVSVPCLCILGTVIIMISIVIHVVKRDRLFRNYDSSRDVEAGAEELEADFLARLLRRELTLQAIFYVLAFLLTYGWIVVLALLTRANIPTPVFLSVLIATFFPLTGFFNILIYTRPKIVAYRRLRSDVSWLVAFWHVIKAGGENPCALPSSLSSRSPKFCEKGLFSCFQYRKHENQKRDIPLSRILRLRSLYENRNASPSDLQTQEHMHRLCFAGKYSIERKISIESNAVQHDTEEGYKEENHSEVREDLDISQEDTQEEENVGHKKRHDRNVVQDITVLSTQRSVISKAFEKASQRAEAMYTIRDVNKMTSNQRITNTEGFDNRSYSHWSNCGASQGSFIESSIVVDNESDDGKTTTRN